MLNKTDLLSLDQQKVLGEAFPEVVLVSALSGAGIDRLRSLLEQVLVAESPSAEVTLVTNVRQQNAITRALTSLQQAYEGAPHTPHEMLMLDMYEALRSLDELTGDTTSESILNEIFSTSALESREQDVLRLPACGRETDTPVWSHRTSGGLMASRILRLPTVLLRTGLSRSTVYARVAKARSRDSSRLVRTRLDQAFVLKGVRFCGSPWTPPFMRWHFMAEESRLASLYSGMPDTLDMLVTHGPPRGILDSGWQEPHVGSTALADAIATRQIAHHVFGYLHNAGGQSIQRGDTTFHNVAACNEQYVLVNQPNIIELSN